MESNSKKNSKRLSDKSDNSTLPFNKTCIISRKKSEKENFSSTTPNNTNTNTKITLLDKPISLICYLCGREYGTKSLIIHLKTCKDNYKREKNYDPESIKPELFDSLFETIEDKKEINFELLEQYNKQANDIYKDENLFPCPNCGRKFLQDRLEVHSKGCKPKKENSSTNLNKKKSLVLTSNNSITGSNNTNSMNMTTKNKLSKSMLIPGSGITIKPTFLVCFICGRDYGKHSIEFHLKSCYEKNTDNFNPIITNKVNKLDIPPELDQILNLLSINEEPSIFEIKNYNEIAMRIFTEKTMKPCLGCKRRFLADRLEVHIKGCKAYNEYAYKNPLSPKMTARPKMLMCPLCGREFGSMSLPIHMKTCRDAFDREQMILPKHQRRSADNILEKYNEVNKSMKSGGNYNMDNLNGDAYNIWKEEALVPCEICGRTFLPDRLQVHARSCKIKIKK